jgi:hypothetical protein
MEGTVTTNIHREPLSADQVVLPSRSLWRRLPLPAAVVGLAALAAAVGLGVGAPRQLMHSYLVAFLFFLSFALGGLFFVLVQFVTRAGWSVAVRRLAENAMMTLPLFLLLFVPVAVYSVHLYPWANTGLVAADPLLQEKSGYLNLGFFLIRAAVFFGVWIVLGAVFYRRSVAQDQDGSLAHTRRLQAIAAPGLVLLGLTITFAAFDWVMSLDPHWYSTIFGVYFFAGTVVAVTALLVLLGGALRRVGGMDALITVEHFHDLGKLLFAFTMFWAYIAFSQFMLIWYANLPEETVWYHHRAEGSWLALSSVLAAGHFVFPFFVLMARVVKRRPGLLVGGALWMLAMHYLDLYWLVMPNLEAHGAHPSLIDLLSFFGVGGLFVAALTYLMGRKALVPWRDPRLSESLALENQ